MYEYVDILLKKIKHKLIDNIQEVKSYYQLPDETLQQILTSNWVEYVNHNEDDD